MNEVYQSAFLKALGWSLIDSLWQMGLLWLVYVILTGNGKKYESRQRHTIALLSLAGGAVWFMITLAMHFYNAASAPAVISLYPDEQLSLGLFSHTSRLIESALPLLSMAYLLAAVWLFIRFYHRYRQTQQILKVQTVKAAPELRVFLQQAAAHMGIKKNVVLRLSSAVEVPMTMGFWKPVILLPLAIVNHLSIKQTEAILLHELKHIKRNDYLINILMACVEVILFFNPFAKWLSNVIRKERENSCDDLVLQFRYDPAEYATSLLILEQQRTAPGCNLAVAATGSKTPVLLHRVKRILQQPQVSTPVSQRMIAYLLTALTFGFIGLYNPGNVIVKKVYPYIFNNNGDLRQVKFETPAAKDKKSDHQVCKAGKKKPCKKEESINPDMMPSLVELSADDAERILQLAYDIQAASKIEHHQAVETQLNIQVNNNFDQRDYTMISYAAAAPDPAPVYTAEIRAYVPARTFYYQYMQDSTTPKEYPVVSPQLQARQAMEKAMAALRQIDWPKLERELSDKGVKMSGTEIRKELQKAFLEITCLRLSQYAQGNAEEEAAMYSKAQAEWQKKLENYQRQRQRKVAERDQLRQEIIEERLLENIKPEMKAKVRKKVVDI
ncbi:M56 family metallopeptidase [Pseudoflavitalea sp. G-6-1-2]|uniref:M56 family metallopeptidase n=1 Tax=Pseudoflavitalea sp. G-6-1-2 TaxID=2728841 RepID=UPI00146A254B|nr:M56 family metallopeptidase [Pseudoflavitalea sp. G-6-1-2]NML23631.1 M56 family metallopeptidase [Pseudoflavitalea sp. G-6-1-2]